MASSATMHCSNNGDNPQSKSILTSTPADTAVHQNTITSAHDHQLQQQQQQQQQPSAGCTQPPPSATTGRRRRDISKTMSATKNLRAISLALVQKLKKAPRGIPSTEIANQLAKEAVRQVVGSTTSKPSASTDHVTNTELLAVEKNIRRRLYDSLKVLVSVGAISRSRSDKILHWRGTSHLLPPHPNSPNPAPTKTTTPTTTTTPPMPSLTTNGTDFTSPTHSARTEAIINGIEQVRHRLDHKIIILRQLQQQKSALEQLCLRNRRVQQHRKHDADHNNSNNDNDPNQNHHQNKIHLPFVVVRTANDSDINLVSNPDFTSMTFQFSHNFEIINDSAVLNRLFCVDPQHPPEQQPANQSVASNEESGAIRDKNSSQKTTSRTTGKKRKAESEVLVHVKDEEKDSGREALFKEQQNHDDASSGGQIIGDQGEEQNQAVLCSPKRVRMTSGFASPFVKYTSSEKPPRSPAAALVRRRARRQQRRLASHQQPQRDSDIVPSLPAEPPDPETASLSPSVLLSAPLAPVATTTTTTAIDTTPPRLVSWANPDACGEQVIVEHDDDAAATLSAWPKNTADDNRALAIACRRLYALPRGDVDRDMREHSHVDDDFIGSPLVTPNNWLSNSNSNAALRSKSCTASMDARDLPTRQLLFND